jgi:hypothetical protein
MLDLLALLNLRRELGAALVNLPMKLRYPQSCRSEHAREGASRK